MTQMTQDRPQSSPSNSAAPIFQIRRVRTPKDLECAITLIKAYTASLDIDLSYQNFDSEIALMPGAYAPPDGELLIAMQAESACPDQDLNQRELEKGLENETRNQEPSCYCDSDDPGKVLGCIALRALHLQAESTMQSGDDGLEVVSSKVNCDNLKMKTKYCELKRLYVAPAARGLGVGTALVHTILAIAREIGYEEVRLDTLPNMREAIQMYRGFGFREVEKYYETAIGGTVFLGLRL
ncbi:hypothetical protein AJ79_04207 [Helicocarpus griseus UAMH5409]|uniref:N-acetyltransferase domain-containing protein n=1 Tax=Helicocarpus griseus UAMH5409 TaxID=1447875 RepID=A0A2B7XTQ9_9EURO|nr:hypothetical protein AJ79_04207 [Helicocarpus griseus UAMH5409]